VPTNYSMLLLRWDPPDGADPPRTAEEVWPLFHEHLSIGDNAWMFTSQRSWLTGLLQGLCHAVGADCPEALWAFDPFVLTPPDLHRAADALDAVLARLGDRETAAVLDGRPAGLERLDRALLARLEPEHEIDWSDSEDHPAEAAGTFLLSLREAVADALRQRCWLVGVNSS
jgi:hypothetical protein